MQAQLKHCLKLAISFSLGVLLTLIISIKHRPLIDSLYHKSLMRTSYDEKHTKQLSCERESWDDESEAEELKRKVRILCWILTTPQTIQEKGYFVNATWAKRCTKYVFMSTRPHNQYPVVVLNIDEKRENLWEKTKAAFEYVHDKYGENFDFFMKADDDTYVVMENLRYFLHKQNPEEPLYAGREFMYTSTSINITYMSGGAGYVLSREMLRRLVRKGIRVKSNAHCNQKTEFEDLFLGQCVMSLGAKILPSLDSCKKERFHPLSAKDMFNKQRMPDWMYERNVHPFSPCMKCISNLSITFHYTRREDMLLMEFLVYHIKPYGIKPFWQ